MEAVVVLVKRHFYVLALALAAVLSYAAFEYASHYRAAPATRLPEMSFYDKLDRRITLDQLKGRVVLVNLWAAWCAPCVAELPALAKLQKKLAGKPFTVVAISMDKSSGKEIRHFLDQHGAGNLEVYSDKDRQVPLQWKYEGLPTSFLIDREGTFIKQYNGGYKWDGGPLLHEVTALGHLQ